MKNIIKYFNKAKKYIPVSVKVYIKESFNDILFRLYLFKILISKKNNKIFSFKEKDFKKKKKTRILFVMGLSDFGGVETAFFYILEGLKKENVEVIVAVEGMVNYDKKAKIFKKLGATSYDFTHTSTQIFKRTILSIKLLKLATSSKLDKLFISNSLIGYQLAPMFKIIDPKIYVIDWIHNHTSSFINYSKRFKDNIDTTIVANDLIKKTIKKKFNCPKKSIYLIHNCAKVKKTVDILDLKIPKTINISFVGRLEKDKRPDIFLRVAEEILKIKPDIQFSFIGDGSLRIKLQKETFDLKLTRNIKFLGYHKDISKFLDRSYLVLITSPIEGSPLIAFESMAHGIPVIASNVGGLPEIIRNGVDGYLVEFQDINQYVKRTLTLIDNPVIRRRMSMSSYSRVKQKFSNEIYLKRMKSILLN